MVLKSGSSTEAGTELSTLPSADDASKAEPAMPVSDSSTVESPCDDDDDDSHPDDN